MPVSLAIRFPAGRFHATPWGHDVNEGLPEWPPSPWRLLRAFVATWKRKLSGESSVETHLPVALAELATYKPEFALPPATLGHTRHFMPLKFPDQGDRTKVFDAFVSLSPDSEVIVHWPEATLSNDAQQTLALVLAHMGYLGRAESWAAARVLMDFNPADINCRAGPARTDQESVRVLTTDPDKWNAWDFQDRKIPKPDPLWNLLAETADMHQEKWSDPPGSKWVTYARPSNCFAPKPAARRQPAARPTRPTLARFALDGPVLPLVTETLPLAERARRVLLSKCKYLTLRENPGLSDGLGDAEVWRRCPAFWGKDELGRPRVGHQHAFFLPADEDSDGRIDHLTIFAPMGFNSLECQALHRLRQIQLDASRSSEASRVASAPGAAPGEVLQLLLIGLANPSDFRSPLLAESRTWVSATPFVVTRYPKLRGRKKDRPEDRVTPQAFTAHVLRQELARLGERLAELPPIESIVEEAIGARRLRPIQFKRFRNKRGDDGGRRPAGGFRITFAAPVRGPLCLGHSCHFGLGLFVQLPSPTAPRETR